MKALLAGILFSISPTIWAQASLTVVTEEYPPYNYTNNAGELQGIAVDLAKLLLKRTGFADVEIQLLPWNKAYSMALKKPNTLIFTLTRSPRREDLFHWIGNISTQNIYLYQNRSRKDILLPDLESARQYRVGAVRGWDSTVWLTQQGIPVLEIDETWLGLKMMELGSLDLTPNSELSLAYDAAKYGINPSHYMKALKIRKTVTEFAMSKNSDPKLVKKLQTAYKKIRYNGEYQRIYDKYVFLDLYDKPVMKALKK